MFYFPIEITLSYLYLIKTFLCRRREGRNSDEKGAGRRQQKNRAKAQKTQQRPTWTGLAYVLWIWRHYCQNIRHGGITSLPENGIDCHEFLSWRFNAILWKQLWFIFHGFGITRCFNDTVLANLSAFHILRKGVGDSFTSACTYY